MIPAAKYLHCPCQLVPAIGRSEKDGCRERGRAGRRAAEAAAQAAEPATPTGAFLHGLVEPQTLIERVGTCVLIVIIAVIVYTVVMMMFARAVRRVEQEAEEAVDPRRRRQQRIVTVLALLRSIASWVIIITSGIWVLSAAGMDIRPILAGAGILGLAVGFGAQNLVHDIVSGFFILLEGQYAVGDYVQVAGLFGLVESIGVRVTVLKDLDNQHHHVPNGAIGAVTVYEEPYVNFVVETPLADHEQAAEAAQAIGDLAHELRAEYPHHLVHAGQPATVERDVGALVRLPVAVLPTQEWFCNEEIPQRIKEMLAAREIALAEGRDLRTYNDLSRMPEYKHEEGTED